MFLIKQLGFVQLPRLWKDLSPTLARLNLHQQPVRWCSDASANISSSLRDEEAEER